MDQFISGDVICVAATRASDLVLEGSLLKPRRGEVTLQVW